MSKNIAIIHRKYPDKQERKELLSLFREKTPCTQGKNPALGIFPKATIYTEIANIIKTNRCL
jgi:hypothetical protein